MRNEINRDSAVIRTVVAQGIKQLWKATVTPAQVSLWLYWLVAAPTRFCSRAITKGRKRDDTKRRNKPSVIGRDQT